MTSNYPQFSSKLISLISTVSTVIFFSTPNNKKHVVPGGVTPAEQRSGVASPRWSRDVSHQALVMTGQPTPPLPFPWKLVAILSKLVYFTYLRDVNNLLIGMNVHLLPIVTK